MLFVVRKPTEGSVDWLDRLAAGASFACLVHCVGLPLIVAALPALASFLSLPESLHLWVLAFAIPTASVALASGVASHADRRPLIFGLAGIATLTAAASLPEGMAMETPATVLGSLILAIAHIWNWRLRHGCRAYR